MLVHLGTLSIMIHSHQGLSDAIKKEFKYLDLQGPYCKFPKDKEN